MKNLTKYSWAKTVLFVAIMVMGALICTSCGDDDKDRPSETSNELVGQWFNLYQGQIVKWNWYKFNADGTGEEPRDKFVDEVLTFTYTYDSKTNELVLKYDDFDEYGYEIYNIEWISENHIKLSDSAEYVRL